METWENVVDLTCGSIDFGSRESIEIERLIVTKKCY